MSGCPGKAGKVECLNRNIVVFSLWLLSRIDSEVVQLEVQVGDVRPEPSTGTAYY